ncbi:glutathione binding-like protein [Rhizobium leguminosarum]
MRYLTWLAGSRQWLAGERMSYADLAAAASI